MINKAGIQSYMRSRDWGRREKRLRLVSFLSAAIAVGRNDITKEILRFMKGRRVKRKTVYETILQSYLFLGFPRMIEAAICVSEIYGVGREEILITAYSSEETKKWFRQGSRLCQKVYGKNFFLLEERFRLMAPEIFRWMVNEGYGKVLSRPGLTQIERELAEVAALIVEQRERQLVSHLIGSLNVGAGADLLRTVSRDILPLAGKQAVQSAEKNIRTIEKKYATEK